MTVELPTASHVCDDRCRSFPLSYGQRSIWLLERLHPRSVANRLAYAFRIQDTLDVPAVVEAMQLLIDRHPMLRATFDEVDGVPVQTVHSHQVVDCRTES